MSPELQNFLDENSLAVIAGATAIAIVAIMQWFKTRQMELRGGEMLADVDLAQLARAAQVAWEMPRAQRRGCIEQFGQLPLPTQIMTVVALMVGSIVSVSVVGATIGNTAFHARHGYATSSFVQVRDVPTPLGYAGDGNIRPSGAEAGIAVPVAGVQIPAAIGAAVSTPDSPASKPPLETLDRVATPIVPCAVLAVAPGAFDDVHDDMAEFPTTWEGIGRAWPPIR